MEWKLKKYSRPKVKTEGAMVLVSYILVYCEAINNASHYASVRIGILCSVQNVCACVSPLGKHYESTFLKIFSVSKENIPLVL